MFRVISSILIICFATVSYAEDKIRFGVFAYLGYEKTKEKFEPLVEYLNTKLTKKVVLEVLTQEEMDQKIKSKELDIATTNPTHFLVIRNSENLSGALATEMGISNNIVTDKLAGLILVNEDSQINSLKDIKHKKIAIPSFKHMGGFRAQAYEFYLNDIDVEKENEIVTAKIHQESIKKLLAKEVDIAFVREGIYEQMIADGELKAGDVKIINEQKDINFPFKISTRTYPQWPIFALSSAKKEDIKELIRALYSFDSNSVYAKKSKIYGYSLPADYLVVENMARALRLPPYEDIGHIYKEDIWKQHNNEIIIFLTALGIVALYYLYARNKRMIIEEKNRTEKDFVSAIIDNANTIIAIIDNKGVMYKVNKFAQEFTGYSEAEIQSEPYFWKRFLPKGIQDKVVKIIENADKGIVQKSFQNSWISRNGEEKIFEWSNALVQHSDGTMNYLVTIGIDITQQIKQLKIIHQKNNELQKAQLKFQTLFEESLDGIVLMDPQTQKFIEFNHHACEMYGYTKEEFSFLTPKDLDALQNQEQIIASQQAILIKGWDKFTTKHKTKTGEIKDIIVSVKVLTIDGKHILHATFHDITSMTRQSVLLEQQKEEFETIFNYSKDGIAILDLNSNFLSFNDAYVEMTGFSKEELLQKSCLELTAPEDQERSKKAFEFVLEHQHLENYEKNCIVNHNKVIITNMSISMLPDKKRILLVTKDVTSLKLFESQSKLASMGEMIGNIAHQWRQPLSVISTMASGIAFKKEYGVLKDDELISYILHSRQLITS